MAWENFYATKLSVEIGTSDTTLTVDTAPTKTSGRLVLEARNPTQREIISYTGVSGNDLTGVSRGQGGTTAKTHNQGALVEMNVVAEDLEDALAVPGDIRTRFDEALDDFVASGMVWSQTAGLVGEMTAGVIYVSGYREEVDAVASKTFSASKDTYVDVDNTGGIDYNEEDNDDPAPALAANHIRIAKVVTDGTTITGITDLRSLTPVTGLLQNVRVYTFDGTDIFINGVDQNNAANTIDWTKPAGLKHIEVEVVGGGGGSAVAGSTSSGQASEASGGGGGEYAKGRIAAGDLGSTETVTVGAGGTGQTSGTGDGGTGGTSSLGALITAIGGTGGIYMAGSGGNAFNLGGIGGTGGTGGEIRIGGTAGGPGVISGGTTFAVGRMNLGGNSFMSGRARAVGSSSSGNAVAGIDYGGGASGARNSPSSSLSVGADGAAGIVIIREYF